MDVAAQRNTLENKLREWTKPAPTPTPFVPPRTVRGVRGVDGNPALKPAVASGVNYPPMPDTTPPQSPSDPQNPPPLPDKEDDAEADAEDEDDSWQDQEEDEGGPVYDEGGRETYVPPADVAGPSKPLSKIDLALEQQRKEDAERFGGKLGATVMAEARATRQIDNPDIPPFPFEKMHEIATEKGLNADKIVGEAKRAYELWNAYASNIKARALAGDDVPKAQLDEMKRLGQECCRIPAMLLGIPESALPEMIEEINKTADTSPEALAAKADADATEMYNFSVGTVKIGMEHFKDDAMKMSAALTGAMALHFLGYNDRGYRRVRLAESFAQIMLAYSQQEAEEDAAKANADSSEVSELGGAKDQPATAS